MENFTPYSAFFGGCLIGLSAALLLFFNGRIAGISGMIAGAFSEKDKHWRWFFLGSLIISAAVFSHFFQSSPATYSRSTLLLIVSGVLVGYGTRLGNGCTSGHAVCGLARFSKRSAAATVTFMAMAMFTVYVTRHLLGVSI
jgi:uncharacterized membrane protein YedE/YeeE